MEGLVRGRAAPPVCSGSGRLQGQGLRCGTGTKPKGRGRRSGVVGRVLNRRPVLEVGSSIADDWVVIGNMVTLRGSGRCECDVGHIDTYCGISVYCALHATRGNLRSFIAKLAIFLKLEDTTCRSGELLAVQSWELSK